MAAQADPRACVGGTEVWLELSRQDQPVREEGALSHHVGWEHGVRALHAIHLARQSLTLSRVSTLGWSSLLTGLEEPPRHPILMECGEAWLCTHAVACDSVSVWTLAAVDPHSRWELSLCGRLYSAGFDKPDPVTRLTSFSNAGRKMAAGQGLTFWAVGG